MNKLKMATGPTQQLSQTQNVGDVAGRKQSLALAKSVSASGPTAGKIEEATLKLQKNETSSRPEGLVQTT